MLKPGGRLLVINETLKTRHDPIGVHAEAVAQFEGYEHAHWALQYRGEAMRAGFSTRLIEPRYHGSSAPRPGPAARRCASGARAPARAQAAPVGRRAYLCGSTTSPAASRSG